ncbi:FHA domain-containing protein [Methylomonas koyamae]|uniref:Forkhead-associated protein n=1 Tax=Methylomonas koyamae TaxID=702114 RepID=A0AA91DAP4_9GAMM|nr:FHA domain-containing protein [Methylomonas koyamae]OAI24083.1 forkhead-associated protein [Methylomonas koyamae]
MEDDKTVLMRSKPAAAQADPDRTLLVGANRLAASLVDAAGRSVAGYTFTGDFRVGRSADNDIVIQDPAVSRHHCEIKFSDGSWWLHDLNSSHGVYLEGLRVPGKVKLALPATIGFGPAPFGLKLSDPTAQPKPVLPQPGAVAAVVPAEPQPPQHGQSRPQLTPEQIRNRLLSEQESEDMGDYTRMVRGFIREDRTVRTKSYKKWIWSLAGLLVLVAGLAVYQRFALDNARTLAINMFYDIKTLEVSLSQADIRLEQSAETLAQTLAAVNDEKLRVSQERIKEEQLRIQQEKKRLAEERERLKAMKVKYQAYLQQVDFLRLSFPTDEEYERELVTRVARGFGESELEVPEEFVAKVKQYIDNWKNSSRLQLAVRNLETNQYAPIVLSELEKEGLPAYFLYLPLQESNYDSKAVGPETRFGIAKGAWQFLATTGQDYGLVPGPLANTRDYDEQDARFDFNQATRAGAKYLKYIYGTQAQASGLLVMASYNYGHNKVRSMVENMPDNPRDKNFWKFIQQYEIPAETYDYVFYIVSAAVIGEDPKHFGFDFKPPLLATLPLPG